MFLANEMDAFILELVETLVAKTRTCDESCGFSFIYYGVPILAVLDEYVMLREEREEDKKMMVSSTLALKIGSRWLPNPECSSLYGKLISYF